MGLQLINGILVQEVRESRAAGRTPRYYLSKCRTFLPILLAAAATMDSVIPVKNHDSKQCWVTGENSPRSNVTHGIVLIKINTCAYDDYIVLGRQIVLHDCLLPQLSLDLGETNSRRSSAFTRVYDYIQIVRRYDQFRLINSSSLATGYQCRNPCKSRAPPRKHKLSLRFSCARAFTPFCSEFDRTV